jgi:uncharacterized protein YkwD
MPIVALAPSLVVLANQVREWGMSCSGKWLPPSQALQLVTGLEVSAAVHAEDMAVRGFFSHENPDGLGPVERARAAGYTGDVAEILVWGADTAEHAIETWLASPEHCKSMLSKRYTQAGAAWASARGKLFWVIVLGKPGA